ncbi:uncharacterized SAM-binding protein YcdF (DUF218 family) [Alicyclobacillus sacchari]|uniref:Uncharacterized SAM-binding protein YcdF (DUF218 family) n=1 Tax=Alicyclobacillus sacchari TaxID=392010 RepID=A0A4R8LUA2_9BACL|nr:YdcF family protein [Alicyclobacillus sacchari]TDY51234.1 uncharacterized SAM-binding protein YcdF (DUF218 family) [Alicyclobacillus sacchari]GMA56511.1 hypothetical protein GCM10025858_10140 [Alicyclobacillus sacchari]
MFVAVKIAESLLIPPGLFVLALVLAGLFGLRRYAWLARTNIAIALIIAIVSTQWFANLLLRPLESAYPQPKHPHADAIVVLGGGFTTGTPDVTGLGNLYGDSSVRLLAAAMLYRRLHVPILLSGGPNTRSGGRSYSFAAIGARDLAALGVPNNMIWQEPNSRNTEENASFSAIILRAHHAQTPLIMTSAYHMRRAVLDFNKFGVTATPYPVGYLVNRAASNDAFGWLPSIAGLSDTTIAVREYLGIAATQLGVRG